MSKVRCAIYTRKSSEEGLEQDFNSLDAQREACSAYVQSQASEGWTLLPDRYDDGGVSGGTLERPALTRLLADIDAGKIDTVVCYKVDRLSRSLFDFAKLVEAFEKAGVSFVSVTQSFNTTTSMGRLTLNMLLSFAQFEREVTAERIRDKIAASKAKGMWMGGTPPLGYRPDGRSLAIVEDHAALVREIYARYLRLGNVRLLAEELNADGIRTPLRTTASGRSHGGSRFTRGPLYHMLRNATYAGRIPHKDRTYEGHHPAIIDPAIFERVQQILAENRQGEVHARLPHRSLLAGRMVDDCGEPMLASHASKQGKRYRYYISRSLQTGTHPRGLRLPAREVEQSVREHTARLFDDPLQLAQHLSLDVSPALLRCLAESCSELAAALRARSGGPLADVVAQVRARDGCLTVELSPVAIANALGVQPKADVPPIVLDIAFRLTRTGRAMRLVQSDGTYAGAAEPNLALVNFVVEARRLWARLSAGDIDVTTLARELDRTPSYVTRMLRTAFLAPDVIDAIIAGRQHGALTVRELRDVNGIPACWDEQRAIFLPITGQRRSSTAARQERC